MSKPEYISIEKGLHTAKPNCFRCGDCCTMIPVELRQEEIIRIARRLKTAEIKLFKESITKDFNAANVIPPWRQDMPSLGVGWLKAPCMFLTWEKHKGHMRAHCKIYKIRPRMCRIFFCGKETKDEHLSTRKYTFKIDGTEDAYTQRILSELRQQRPMFRLP